VNRVVLCACLLALSLAACSEAPLREDVIAQASDAGGQIAFDVVKLDDAVVTTVLDRPKPAFSKRFKEYVPPPDVKIAVGDTVSVVIWEAAANGLFGNSITQLSFPAGAAARLSVGQPPALGTAPTLPGGMTVTPEMLALLFGGAAPAGLSAPRGSSQASLGGAGTGRSRLEQFIGLAEQTGRPGTRIPDQHVGADGAISIPYAGRVKVAGRTPEEVERRIEGLLGPKALQPQALVIVKNSVANSVSVAGEIVRGERVPLGPGGSRLLDVIAAAGGAKAPVHDTFVRLTRHGVTATIALATLVADPEQNIYAEPGDVLTLVRRPQTFSVFGATGKNAAISFNSEHLTLEEALAKAGGLLDQRADPRAVFLFRYEPVALVKALGQPIASNAPKGLSPVVYRLDLQEAKSYLLARRFPVQDKDIIFVANAATVPITYALQVIAQVTGPIYSAALVCQSTSC
jgi:polysaccharide export outer membrane protein